MANSAGGISGAGSIGSTGFGGGAATAADASHADSLSAPAAGNQLSTAPTTEDRLKSSTSTGAAGPARNDTADENGFSRSVTGYQTDDGSITLGSASIEASPPGKSVNPETGMTNFTLISIAVDATAFQAQHNIDLGPAAISGNVTVGTVNAQLEFSAAGSIAKRSAAAKAALGAEAMAREATVTGEVSITGKTIADTVSGVYNQFVDPVVDYIAGEDVPGLPAAPASWDHGITLGGHITAGWGASAKASIGASFSPANGAKIGVSIKHGLGPTVGYGVTLGIK